MLSNGLYFFLSTEKRNSGPKAITDLGNLYGLAKLAVE